MIPELADSTPLDARESLRAVLGVSGVLLVFWAQALLRWRRYGDDTGELSSTSYRGWSIAFGGMLLCIHVFCFGGYWLRLAFGEAVEAEVVRTSESRRRGTMSHRLFAVSTNAERWELDDEIPTELADAVDARLYGPGERETVYAPFLVVPFWPSMHQIGSSATVHPVPVGLAALALLVFLIAYALEAPEFGSSDGILRTVLGAFHGFAGAVQDQFLELPAMGSVAALAGPRLRGEPFNPFDFVFAAILGACLWVLLKRVVGPESRTIEIRKFGVVRFEVPSISAFHFVFDAAWLALGVWVLRPPRSATSLAGGLCLTVVPGLLVVVRLLYWRRRCGDD